ncbi:MAG: hypothetical protein GXZ11_05635 [Tissierellia bacterium]|nr:hypothetical protein [Tissierellia bacterium]
MQNALINAKTLIEKKILIQKKKTKPVHISIQDLGTFKFRTPDMSDVIDSTSFKGGGHEDQYLIYTCCEEPNLRDKELQETYECSEPFDIVDKIFLPGEIQRTAKLLTEACGYKEDAAKVVEEIKNEY